MRILISFAVMVRKFGGAREGVVTLMFGLIVFVLLAAIGIAIDTSRVNRFRTSASASLDAAALATAKQLVENGIADGRLEQLAKAYFESNVRAQRNTDGQFKNFRVEIDRDKGSVVILVDTHLPTAFGRVFGVSEIKETLSTRSVYAARDIELGMMLDVSGSMQGGRLWSLKDAATDLANIILDSSAAPTRNKIGIAPYSTSVNAGVYAQDATNSSSSSNTCVTERTGWQAFTDAPPSDAPLRNKTNQCPDSKVMPLTSDLSALTRSVESLSANGWTAGHLGIAWAWYIVSPEWASFWPSSSAPQAHDPEKVLKAVLIMTDGEFNTYYEGSNGNSKTQALNLCANLRAEGITVFAVGLNAPYSSLDLLRRCATNQRYYYDTQSGKELREAFNNIARELTALRLTH